VSDAGLNVLCSHPFQRKRCSKDRRQRRRAVGGGLLGSEAAVEVIRLRYRASVTLHVPGVHDIEIELAVAVPAQLWGPLTMILPSLARVPVKPLNGAANESEQPVCVTATLCPTSEGSQCCVMFQVPATLGHVEPPSPPLEDDELELQARRHRSATRERVGCMISSYVGRRAQGGFLAGAPVAEAAGMQWRESSLVSKISPRIGSIRED